MIRLIRLALVISHDLSLSLLAYRERTWLHGKYLDTTSLVLHQDLINSIMIQTRKSNVKNH